LRNQIAGKRRVVENVKREYLYKKRERETGKNVFEVKSS